MGKEQHPKFTNHGAENFAKSETAWRQAANKGDGEAAFHLGLLLEDQHKIEEAEAAYQQAIDSRHDKAAPYAAYNLGILLERRDIERAKAAYQLAIDSRHPEVSPMAMLNRGLLLMRQNDMKGAKAAYQWVIDSGHTETAPPAEVNLGYLLNKEGDIEGAKAAYPGSVNYCWGEALENKRSKALRG